MPFAVDRKTRSWNSLITADTFHNLFSTGHLNVFTANFTSREQIRLMENELGKRKIKSDPSTGNFEQAVIMSPDCNILKISRIPLFSPFWPQIFLLSDTTFFVLSFEHPYQRKT